MSGKVLIVLGIVVLGLLLGLAVACWLTTYHPAEQEVLPVHGDPAAPWLPRDQGLKVLSWNVQFMAGKEYVFFFDQLDGRGPDRRPSPAAIARTLDEVARVIREEAPDLVLLQEVDDGAARTDRQDQLAELLRRLPDRYGHASAFYWRAAFVPHPQILGATGMKLSVLSRYRIEQAVRLALPGSESGDPISAQFNIKRAILEVWLPRAGGGHLVVLNTHLAAFAQRSDIMQRQVARVAARLQELDGQGIPWLLAGDLNLLPPGPAYAELPAGEQAYFNPTTELTELTDRWPMVPELAVLTGPDRATWFTHFPNGARASGPDRTIDYLFHSRALQHTAARVRQADTLAISDHLPLIVELR